MVEHSIIRLFVGNTELYEKYSPSLKLDYVRQNYPVLYKCFKSLPASSMEVLEANYMANFPVIKEGDRDTLKTVINDIKNAEATADEIIPYLESHLARAWAANVAILALDVAEGRTTVDQLDEVIGERDSSLLIEAEQIEFVTTDIEELIKDENLEGGLKWRLKCLNQSLGPLRKGNFGHIFARVETGKTAMWVSEATFMAEQVDRPILIFFNEEGGRDVVFRMYNAITGMTYMEIAQNPKLAKQIWEKKIGDRIKFVDNPVHVERKAIERTIEQVDPSLIIVDNMDKVKGFTGDRKDLLLHEIYKWGRDIAKTQCPFLTVGQADSTSHNSMVIDESQLADSKTAKPSELDFILGIGRIDKEGHENVRYLTLSKNKLRGDMNTIEGMRHMRAHQVLLKPHFSIYEDM